MPRLRISKNIFILLICFCCIVTSVFNAFCKAKFTKSWLARHLVRSVRASRTSMQQATWGSWSSMHWFIENYTSLKSAKKEKNILKRSASAPNIDVVIKRKCHKYLKYLLRSLQLQHYIEEIKALNATKQGSLKVKQNWFFSEINISCHIFWSCRKRFEFMCPSNTSSILHFF